MRSTSLPLWFHSSREDIAHWAQRIVSRRRLCSCSDHPSTLEPSSADRWWSIAVWNSVLRTRLRRSVEHFLAVNEDRLTFDGFQLFVCFRDQLFNSFLVLIGFESVLFLQLANVLFVFIDQLGRRETISWRKANHWLDEAKTDANQPEMISQIGHYGVITSDYLHYAHLLLFVLMSQFLFHGELVDLLQLVLRFLLLLVQRLFVFTFDLL